MQNTTTGPSVVFCDLLLCPAVEMWPTDGLVSSACLGLRVCLDVRVGKIFQDQSPTKLHQN